MKRNNTRRGAVAGILAALMLLVPVLGCAAQGDEEQADAPLVTAPVLVGDTAPVSADDLQNHWVWQYAEILIERGILEADPDGQYRPKALATRVELLGWVMAAWGGEYGDPADAAMERNILDEEDLEDDAGTITRNLTAKVSVRTLMNLFGETDDGFDYYTVSLQLEDYDACHACRGFVAGAYGFGLMSGRVPGLFSGEELLTRAEAWTVVARMLAPELRRYPEPEEEGNVLLTAESAYQLIQNYDAILLDVRNESELVEAGFIPGSILVPLAELKETDAAALLGHEDDPIIVYCAGGVRSAQACDFLRELGFKAVYDLGGIGNWTFGLEYPDTDGLLSSPN